MFESLMRYVANLPVVPRAYASAKAAISRRPLPPGEFVLLEPEERSDRLFLLRQSERVGPVFKAIGGRRFMVCVLGLPLCRRFLQEHATDITPVAMVLEPLFPKGFLRQMKGEDHKKYRTSLMRAIDYEVLARDRALLATIIGRGLEAYAVNQGEEASPPEVYIRTLNTIASGLLIHIFFGARIGSMPFNDLMRLYDDLGPDGLEWFIGRREREGFNKIRDYLLETLNGGNGHDAGWIRQSIVGRLHEAGGLDETSLGNLIYMVEMGRFDIHCLFRWLSKYAAEHPALCERMATEPTSNPQAGIPLSEAFVLETLRLNQSERLMRVVNRDIQFEGYLIPKHSTVRLCVWESHKSPDSFPDPFLFKPERFMTQTVSKEQFAPFGLDHHGCPFAEVAVKLSSLFVSVLTQGYTVTPVADGPSFRGRYHWQPAKTFSVRLSPATT